MTPCTTTNIAKPISYCGAACTGYGTPILHVGQLVVSAPDAIVVLEDQATGRTTFHPNIGTAPAIDIDFPPNLSPGHVYRVTVDVDGVEVLFRPYAENSIIGTDQVMALSVNARKVFDEDGNVICSSAQWLKV